MVKMGQLGRIQSSLIVTTLLFILISCANKEEKERKTFKETHPTKKNRPVSEPPTFNEDTAYSLIQKQVNFGPRYPNIPAHDSCAQFLKNKLIGYGFNTHIQEGKVIAFNKAPLIAKNIIAKYNPDSSYRILLAAHWDSRPFADRDTENQNKPILAADDGGSGVAVILEIARQIQLKNPGIGIDIVFFDAEDYGKPSNLEINSETQEDTWCLGSQYWAKNRNEKFTPKFGILLDMVGSKGAIFPKEGNSMYYAQQQTNKLWQKAIAMGYGEYFKDTEIYGLIDDHLYTNKLAAIPCIDIINFNPATRSFGTYHHTHKDNMEIIDKTTLKVVGQVLLEVIYKGL